MSVIATASSRERAKRITVYLKPGSQLPFWVNLGHRHLEKAPPEIPAGSTDIPIIVPVDLLRVAGMPSTMIEDIESLEIVYQRHVARVIGFTGSQR